MRLPLLQLELQRVGTRKSSFLLRTLVPLAALLYLGLFYGRGARGTQTQQVEYLSQMFAMVLQYVYLALVFGVAPLLTAGLIAQEKREDTLGTLLLADFRGWDILSAKLCSAFLLIVLLLLTTLPIAASVSFLGGSTTQNIALAVLASSCLAFTVCALGLFSSTVCRTPFEALFLTAVLEALWVVPTDFLHQTFRLRCSVLQFMTQVFRGDLSSQAWVHQAWVQTIVPALLIGAVAFWLAWVYLPRAAIESPRAARSRLPLPARRPGKQHSLHALFAASIDGLPIHTWPKWPRRLAWVAVTLLGFLPCAGSMLIRALICYDITSSIEAARRSGALDLLVMTPDSGRWLPRTILRVFARRALLFLPAFVAPYLPHLLPYLIRAVSGSGPQHLWSQIIASCVDPFIWVAIGALAATLPFRAGTQAAIVLLAVSALTMASQRLLIVPLMGVMMLPAGLYILCVTGLHLLLMSIIGYFAYREFRARLRNGRFANAA